MDECLQPIAVARSEEEANRLAYERQPFLFPGGERLTPEAFVEKFGDKPMRVSVEAATLPRSKETLTVRAYTAAYRDAKDLPTSELSTLPYAFHDVTGHDEDSYDNAEVTGIPEEPEEDDPFAEFVLGAALPIFFKRLSKIFSCVGARVALGPIGSYADLHSHGAALNQVLYGEKRWKIYHPSVTPSLIQIARQLQVPNKNKFLEQELAPLARSKRGDVCHLVLEKYREWNSRGLCPAPNEADTLWYRPMPAELLLGTSITQRAGDTVSLPNDWGHAVENLDLTLCRIYELATPTASTKRMSEARQIDSEGAAVVLRKDFRVAMSEGQVFLETREPLDPIVVEVLGRIDGRKTARELANECSNPEAASALLQAYHGVLFDRAKPA